MGLPFKVGDRVKQKVYVIEGVVSELVLTDDNSKVQYVVDYTDLQGEPHKRPFEEDQIEAAE